MDGHMNDDSGLSTTADTMPTNRNEELLAQQSTGPNPIPTKVPMTSRNVPKMKLTKLLFGKNTIHEILGGGNLANLLLWRSPLLSASVILFATLFWAFFTFSKWTVISFTATIVMVGLTNATHFVDHLPPILPYLELKEAEVKRLATNFRIVSNDVFAFLHRLTVDGNMKLFLKSMLYLYLGTKIGACFSFFTLLYVIALLLFVVPKAYELYETDVDRVADIAYEKSKMYYKRADIPAAAKPKAQ